MKFDFVDIGTSDFDTSLDERKKDQIFLLVEPVKYYLDRLPEGKKIFKRNCAISDVNGKGEMYFVDGEIMKKYNMPNWMRGCSSFNKPHETVLRFFNEIKMPVEIKKKTIDVLSFGTLVNLYNITKIGRLKIDTEGHDHIILRSVFDSIKDGLKIKEIKIEYDPFFGNTNELNNLILTSKCLSVLLAGNNVIMKF